MYTSVQPKFYIVNGELYHHGILGQKWGKRQGPPYPLDASDHSSAERKSGWRKSLTKGGEPKQKSKFRKNYERKTSQHYRKYYGMSKKDADEAAAKKASTMKKVAIGAGIAVGAASAVYLYNKVGREYTDNVIKAGKTIQTLSDDPSRMAKGTAFYTAHKEGDKKAYAGMFGRDIAGRNKNKIQAVAEKDIRVAGIPKGRKVFNKMMQENTEFRNAVIKTRNTNYKDFNTYTLLDHRKPAAQKAQTMFYEELKKQGYGGVADINDRKYSGFGTRADIIFDRSNLKKDSAGNLDVKVTKLTNDEQDKGKKYVIARNLLQSPSTVAVASGIAAATVSSHIDTKTARKVRKAKKEAAKKENAEQKKIEAESEETQQDKEKEKKAS